MIANFNRRLRSGEKLFGTMVTSADPAVSESLALLGFDWLFIDGEHGPLETREIQSILQAVGDRAAALVRVPAIDEMPIKKALDLGANGIIVPQVNTVEQVKRVVEFTRYPPLGRRGIGLGRAHGYGKTFDEYMENANSQVTVVIQAEHIDAVNNICEVIAVPGVDAVLVGPYDLSASLGHPGQVDHPKVVEAIQKVTDACQTAKMPLGIFGGTVDSIKPYSDQGYNLLVAGIDIAMLTQAARNLLDDFRER
jgi:2-dehydro-3-deoxyglucarate aldolase